MKSKSIVSVVVAALIVSSVAVFGSPATGSADHHESFTDFEPVGFAVGESVHNHQPDGEEADPPIANIRPDVQAWRVAATAADQEVVDLGGALGKVWRLSDMNLTGNAGTRPHSAKYLGFSGEPGAIDDYGNEIPTSDTFFASLDFRSATGTAQSGMLINVTPTCGDSCSQTYVRIIDDAPNGFDLLYFQTGVGGEFETVELDLNLSYTDWHQLAFFITFVDGENPNGTGNDVVRVYVNGNLVHVGTTWETIYRTDIGDERGIDRLAFSATSIAAASPDGGLYFDNVLISDEFGLEGPPVGEAMLTLCVSMYTGQVTSPGNGQCGPGHYELETPSETPLAFCVNPYSGQIQFSPSGQCSPSLLQHVVPDDGDLVTCVSIYTGRNRRVMNHEQCSMMEIPNLVPAGLVVPD